jgi:glycosyltransferase involved in cell wall biosynthesis
MIDAIQGPPKWDGPDVLLRQTSFRALAEQRLFREADLVFVTSERLRQRAAQFSERVHLFPFGVSFERFEEVRASRDSLPEDVRNLRHPVVGYMGGLHQWVDQDLVAAVASRLPHASFALVGPAQTDVTTLEQCPNITLSGRTPTCRDTSKRSTSASCRTGSRSTRRTSIRPS